MIGHLHQENIVINNISPQHILINTNIPEGKRGLQFMVKLCDLHFCSFEKDFVNVSSFTIMTEEHEVDDNGAFVEASKSSDWKQLFGIAYLCVNGICKRNGGNLKISSVDFSDAITGNYFMDKFLEICHIGKMNANLAQDLLTKAKHLQSFHPKLLHLKTPTTCKSFDMDSDFVVFPVPISDQFDQNAGYITIFIQDGWLFLGKTGWSHIAEEWDISVLSGLCKLEEIDEGGNMLICNKFIKELRVIMRALRKFGIKMSSQPFPKMWSMPQLVFGEMCASGRKLATLHDILMGHGYVDHSIYTWDFLKWNKHNKKWKYVKHAFKSPTASVPFPGSGRNGGVAKKIVRKRRKFI